MNGPFSSWKQMLGRLRAFALDPSQDSLGKITRSDAQHALHQATLFESEWYKQNSAKNIDERLKREQERAKEARKKDSQRLRAVK